MNENQLKKKLKSGETVFGCFVRYADSDIVEFLSLQGFDFLVFDAEHGTIEPRDCQQMVRTAELHGVTPLIRVPTNQRAVILRYLDTGAQGAHVPMIQSRTDAEAAVDAVKYPSQGQRGLAASRAADFGQRTPLGEYAEFANEQTLLIAAIETAAGVDALPQILELDAVDVIFIGPTDLSTSLGVSGQMDHPKMQQTLDRIIEMVAGSDKILATIVGNAEAAKKWVQRGARCISITTEALIKSSSHAYLKSVRRG